MSITVKKQNAIMALIEAAHAVSIKFNVPLEVLIEDMLATAKQDSVKRMLRLADEEALHPPGTSLVPTSARYQHLLTLIQRDDPQLYRKLTGLD